MVDCVGILRDENFAPAEPQLEAHSESPARTAMSTMAASPVQHSFWVALYLMKLKRRRTLNISLTSPFNASLRANHHDEFVKADDAIRFREFYFRYRRT